jgi:hypothetical protein
MKFSENHVEPLGDFVLGSGAYRESTGLDFFLQDPPSHGERILDNNQQG